MSEPRIIYHEDKEWCLVSFHQKQVERLLDLSDDLKLKLERYVDECDALKAENAMMREALSEAYDFIRKSHHMDKCHNRNGINCNCGKHLLEAKLKESP